MPARHRSRERALQVLYLCDMRGVDVDAALQEFYGSLAEEARGPVEAPDPFMEELVRGTVQRRGRIDQYLAQHSEHWRLERMSAVDRNILRLAVYEMLWLGTPAPVVIDEAIELARRFSGEEAARFVNGLLDAIHKHVLLPEGEARQSCSGKNPA